MSTHRDFEVVTFASAKAWERWLAREHDRSRGVWLRFCKRGAAAESVRYADALAVALCYGWIDGQVKKHDHESWLRKFTPRRPKSIWSKRNRELAERLIAAERMRPAGLREIAAAKADGRWDRAYDAPSKMVVPEDFLRQLAKNQTALEFFKTLNKANTYAIAWRLQTAKKPETRERRMKAILTMLAEKRSFH